MNTIEKMSTTVSVRDLVGDRQANNLHIGVLAETVRPWYAEWLGSEQVADAIEGLNSEETREAAARFLGLELIAVA